MTEKLTHPEVIAFIQEHFNDDPAMLMLGAHRYPEFPMKDIVNQIASRKKARKKLPEWFSNSHILLPPPDNLEQASSEQTARFKARNIDGGRFADLTGGSGIDTYYLSSQFKESVYVEPDRVLCELAEYNFKALNAEIRVDQNEAEAFLNQVSGSYDLIYLDPSRRNPDRNRVYELSDSSPDVLALYDLLMEKGVQILIKASPMISIPNTLGQLKDTTKVQVIAVDNEVKELLFWLTPGGGREPMIEAWNLKANGVEESFRFTVDEENQSQAPYSLPKKYIYIPNSALMKAGPYKLLASRYDLDKLHPNTHIYTSDEWVEEFPGRIFRLEEHMKASEKTIRKAFPKGKVNVICRNYPDTPNAIKKKYRLKDGGEDFLVFCTLADDKRAALYCRQIQ